MFTRIKNKKEKIVLPQANRLFAPPAASAAERSKTIFCRFHAVILTTGAKKKNSISRLFPVCRPLTTGTEKKSLFSRLPPPGVLYHRREKINLDFSASPSGHPSRRRRKAELIFPASPVCRPSFRCRKAKLVFPGFPRCWLLRLPLAIFSLLFPCSAFLTNPHRQPFSITNPLRACLPRLSPAPKKVCRQPFPLALPSLLFRPSLLFPQSPNGFMPCPFPAPACFFPNFSQTMDFDKKNRAPQDAIFLLLFKFVQFN